MPRYMTKTMVGTLGEWAAEFRSAAHSDKLSIFRDHLRRLGLPNKPKRLLGGTIQMIFFCACYATIDNQKESFFRFLNLQKYDPGEAPEARYAFTFDVHGKTYARVLVDTKVGVLDLADLYNHPWMNHQVVGFEDIWITRPDWAPLSKKEKRSLEKQVEYDLRFDYSDDEIDFWFDDSRDKGALFVHVEDRWDLDEHDDP